MAEKNTKTVREIKDETFSNIRFLPVLKQKLILIILVGILAASAVYVYYNTAVKPKYSSYVMLYVNNASISVGGTSIKMSSGDISASRSMVDTLVVILNNSTVYDEVLEKTGLVEKYTYSQLKGMVSASAENETEIMKITVTSEDAKEAALIADTIAEVLPVKISEIIDGSGTRLVASARVNNSPVSNGAMKNIVRGSLISMALIYGLCLLLDMENQTITSVDYIVETYNVPLLGEIPNLTDMKKTSYYRKRGYYGYSYYGKYGYYGKKEKSSEEGDKKQ